MTKKIILTADMKARLDAVSGVGTGPWLEDQLNSLDPRVFMVIEREMTYAQDVPVNTGIVSPGAASYSWIKRDKIGAVKRIAGEGKDLPTVDVTGEQISATVEQFGAALTYNTREIDAARMAGVNLDTSKADAIRRAFVENRNHVCYFGDSKTQKTGLLNDSAVTKTVAANGANPSSPLWAGKTVLEKYNDIKAMWVRLFTKSGGKVKPTVLLMPPDHYAMAITESFNPDGTNVTLAEQVQKVFGLDLRPRPECCKDNTFEKEDGSKVTGGVKVSGTQYNTGLMFESNAQYVEYLIALDITRRGLQEVGLAAFVPYEDRIVGTVLRAPVAFDQIYGW